LAAARRIGEVFRGRLLELQQQCDLVREVRIAGAMIGVELAVDGAPVVRTCLGRKLLINCTHGTVIRLLPALTLTDEQAHEGCDILAEAIRALAAGNGGR
jgi:acetylornithine/succinyldiaminopimelate/putrescine aminotransferase